jgi:putative FmdB family regulatory protein
MPIYDYRCDHCGHAFSAVQSFKDTALDKCPSCGKRPRRLLTPPAIVFKGSGWYKTDSRVTPKSDSDSGSKDTKSESKSESKPEGKTDSKSDKPSSPKSEAAS